MSDEKLDAEKSETFWGVFVKHKKTAGRLKGN